MENTALPNVSVVVTSRNNEETIGECIESIVQLNYPKKNLEILLIDANSTDKTAQIAAEYGAKVISMPGNAPAAYNFAMKIAKYDILAFIDSDAKVEREWLRKLVPFLNDPKTAGVSGSIETWNAKNPWARSIGYDIKSRYARLGSYAGRVATMNLLFKRKVLEEIGGFDEDFPSQYDTELGYRISSKGYRIAFERNAICYHFNRPTLRAYWKQQLQYGRNTLRLYFKYSGLAKGDEITDFGMNIQPLLILTVILFFFLGFIEILRVLWYVSALILLVMLLYFVFSATRIAVKFNDSSAMRLVVLYYVRLFAWLRGATMAVDNIIRRQGASE
ncbi:MAG: glycosyltransferase [Chloroflexota bacterium]|jgi:cellulose synthase/poly-beta-1,6-N-acetylglucosamine synthase-like glycosyltransferase|nr:glycosyltransferase [Candidatus Sulfotelmatobacter sp.]